MNIMELVCGLNNHGLRQTVSSAGKDRLVRAVAEDGSHSMAEGRRESRRPTDNLELTRKVAMMAPWSVCAKMV